LRNIRKRVPDWLTSLFDPGEGEVLSHIPSLGNIENILRMDAEIAKQVYDRARTQFLKLCFVQAGASGRPEIQKSHQRMQFAREAHTVATTRLNDFILYGTVPENLCTAGDQGSNHSLDGRASSINPERSGRRIP
jgi:hypothetical protein